MSEVRWGVHMWRRFVLSLLLSLLAGCSGGSSSDPRNDSGATASSLLVVRVTTRDPGQRGSIPRLVAPGQARQTSPNRIRVTVSGTGIPTPVAVECLLSPLATGQCQVTETPTEFLVVVTVRVPAGPDRTVMVTVLDEAGEEVFRGTNNVTLAPGVQDVTVVLTPVTNTPPEARAGADQTVLVGTQVTLHGEGSSDLDGNPLTFAWTFVSLPAGSVAVLDAPTAVNPTFLVDRLGTYTVQLSVRDSRGASSAPDIVVISTSSSPPVADAGPDHTVTVGETIFLNGGASTDVDGNPLALTWAFVSRPSGSTATLSGATTVQPSFIVDLPGDYSVELTASDQQAVSTDRVVISTTNSAPVADAGAAHTAALGDTVVLDGSGTTDVDGDALTFTWSFLSQPAGSVATLADPHAIAPTFVVDQLGTYVVQLLASDGQLSSVATVTVSQELPALVAHAGADQAAAVGNLVRFSGSAGGAGDALSLSFAWSLLVRPEGSTATLANSTEAAPTLMLDQLGTYIAQLIVSAGQQVSAPDTVTVSTGNVAPVAVVTAPRTALLGTVPLDGSASFDANGDALRYAWALTARPQGSAATLSDPSAVTPSLVADLPGVYLVQLLVRDATLASVPASSLIAVEAPTVVLELVNAQVIGVGTFGVVRVTLSTPAPAGGTLVTVTSDAPGSLALVEPGTTVIPEGATTGQVQVTGLRPAAVTLRATAPGFVEGTLSVVVVSLRNFVSLPQTLDIPLGQTASLPLTIAPQPAPLGGVVMTLRSSNPGIVEVLTPTVTVPEGALSVNALVRGAAMGTATVSVSNPGFGTDTTMVTTSGVLNILENALSMSVSFPSPLTVQLEHGDVDFAFARTAFPAPAPGMPVTLTSADPTCVTVPATVTIQPGFVSTLVNPSYGGTATLPCATTVTASAPGFATDTVTVTITPVPSLTLFSFPVTVGAGLQTSTLSLSLGARNHGGVTVLLASSDASRVLVSPDEGTSGQGSIALPVPNGTSFVSFVLQGLESAAGTGVTLTASAPGFTTATGDVSVVQPAMELNGLFNTITTVSPLSTLFVQVGIADARNAFIRVPQAVRVGGTPLSASITNSDGRVAQLVTAAGPTQSATVLLPVGDATSPFDVSIGGAAFDPLGLGTTTVAATIPGVMATAAATQTVNVNDPTITLSGVPTIGAGLQTFPLTVFLNGSEHGGVTLTLAIRNPEIAVLAPDGLTTGSPIVTLVIPNGSTQASYVVRGLAPGSTALSASIEGFTSDTTSVTVVQPAFQLQGLPSTTTALSPLSPFQVVLGTPNFSNTGLAQEQALSPSSPAVAATITQSVSTVGQLVTTASTGQSVSITIAPGQSRSPGDVAGGGVAFDPFGSGTTTIAAALPPGFIATTAATQSLTVGTPAVRLFPATSTVGAGLQTQNAFVQLDTGNHGGVTVRLTSDNPAVALVAPDGTTPGTASLDLPLADGRSSTRYVVQGLEGTSGSATLTASVTGFTDGTSTLSVVQPAIQLLEAADITTLSPAIPLQVAVGIPDTTNMFLTDLQAVRAGGNPVMATITTSNPAVGQLVTTATAGLTVSVPLAIGAQISPASLELGGASFEPFTTDTTMISATIPGFLATTQATMAVTVGTPGITLSQQVRVGAGLQSALQAVRLQGADHGGVTLRLTSSNPAVAVVSPNAATPGSAFIDLPVAAAQTTAFYVVQGVEGSAGSIALTASAPGFVDGVGVITVVQPGVTILPFASTFSIESIPRPVQIAVGAPALNGTGLEIPQAVRPGSTALVATITTSNVTVAQLVTTAGSSQTVTVSIPAGQDRSPFRATSGGVDVAPRAVGTSLLQVTIPGFVSTFEATETVTVVP